MSGNALPDTPAGLDSLSTARCPDGPHTRRHRFPELRQIERLGNEVFHAEAAIDRLGWRGQEYGEHDGLALECGAFEILEQFPADPAWHHVVGDDDLKARRVFLEDGEGFGGMGNMVNLGARPEGEQI